MYRSFFNLKEKPFNLTPDPRYLYLNSNHREVLASLKYGIIEKRGFIVITGEVGTGKTTHLFNFLEQLGEQTVSAFIFNPILTREEFFQYIFEDFGLPPGARTKTEYLMGLNRFLLEQADKSVTTVLVIDEAQNLSDDILEEIRLLSNLETTREKLLQIVLVGQPELDKKLQSPSLRQLRQRISIRCRVLPLSDGETGRFIRHRLSVAGYSGEQEIFSPEVVELISRLTWGIPRVVNNLCDNVLLSCYALGRTTADRDVVLEVAADLDLDLDTGSMPQVEASAAKGPVANPVGVRVPTGAQAMAELTEPQVTTVPVDARKREDGRAVDLAAEESPAAKSMKTADKSGDTALLEVEAAESLAEGPRSSRSWERSMKVFQSFINRLKLENE